MFCQSQAFPTEKARLFPAFFIFFKKCQLFSKLPSLLKTPEFHDVVWKKPNWQPCEVKRPEALGGHIKIKGLLLWLNCALNQ